MAKKTTTREQYKEATGRRKSAIARIRLYKSTRRAFEINGETLDSYFKTGQQRATAESAFVAADNIPPFRVTARLKGGGLTAQSEALRHGIARALTLYDEALRVPLKKRGYLKRDPRVKERRKFGLKKARRAPQWSKR